MDENLKEILTDLSEFTLDNILDNEVVKELPVVGTCVRLVRATRSVPDRIFARKVERFVFQLGRVSPEDKAKFRARLDSDADLRRRSGDAVIMALDQADDLQKADILGQLFLHFVSGAIDFAVLRRLMIAADRAFIDDLKSFPGWALQRTSIEFDPKSLAGTGLVNPAYPPSMDGYPAIPTYESSKLGEIYAKLLLEFHPDA
jgi:hypothetical protein